MFTKKDALARIEVQKQVDALSLERDRAFNKGDTEEASRIQKRIEALESPPDELQREQIEAIASPALSTAAQQKQIALKLVQAAHRALGMGRDILLQASPIVREVPVCGEIQEVLTTLAKIQNDIQKIPIV